uniref:Cilia and flagella associated protein 58 n=1 Tax=Eptatretus burgeri TaxID=7764 RepID=A0A8C4Q3S5_EPTBU
MEEEESSFESLEKGIQAVLDELVGDKSLEKFREEYEKLHGALKKSHDSEKRLMSKCRELNAEILANSARVASVMQLSQEDQATIALLKKEIEKAWKMVDTAHEKEMHAKETITSLEADIVNLNAAVEEGNALLGENNIPDLLQQKEELTSERDTLLDVVETLRKQLSDLTNQQMSKEKEAEKLRNDIDQIEQELQTQQAEKSRETRRKEKLEKDVQKLQQELKKQQAKISIQQGQMHQTMEEMQHYEQQLKEQKITKEHMMKDMDNLQCQLSKLSQEHEQQVIAGDMMTQENQLKAAELKAREEEIGQLKQDVSRVSKLREFAQRKLQQAEEQKVEVEQKTEVLHNQITGLEHETELLKKQSESDKKIIENLQNEKGKLHHSIVKANNEIQKQLNIVQLHIQMKKNLEQENNNYRMETQKQENVVYGLEKDRNRNISEIGELTQKMIQQTEEVKVRERQIFEYKKNIAETEMKLKQKQNLYDTMKAERNVLSKTLLEAQNEIEDLKQKLKVMKNQIDQVKEEMASQEAALAKELLQNQHLDKEKDVLKANLQKLKQQAVETKEYIDAQEAEEKRLVKIISEADNERLQQKKELEKVLSERDVLGRQLMRRNDELALLYEKVKILQSTLNKGEVQYQHRLDDIQLLKLEICKLRGQRSMLERGVTSADDLRRKMFCTQRELLREQARCKALEEELDNPMNIHRWRKLEGSDPSTFELIQKIHTLQRRLIKKTEEVVEKELLLQEKEKLYRELKNTQARQPGPEVAEQLLIYQQALRKKTKQMKSLAAELNMYELQCQEYKADNERLNHNIQDSKKKYFAQKRKEQQEKFTCLFSQGLTSYPENGSRVHSSTSHYSNPEDTSLASRINTPYSSSMDAHWLLFVSS